MSERISPQDETARALRGLHRRRDADDDLEEPWCDEDAEDWPCGVIRLLDERDADRAELDVLRGEVERLRAAVEYAANPSVAHPDNSAADITVWVESFADDRAVRSALNACIRLARHALARGVIGE